MAIGVCKVVCLKVFGHSCQILPNIFFDLSRKEETGKIRGGGITIMTFLLAHCVIASKLHERQPTGTSTTHANMDSYDVPQNQNDYFALGYNSEWKKLKIQKNFGSKKNVGQKDFGLVWEGKGGQK